MCGELQLGEEKKKHRKRKKMLKHERKRENRREKKEQVKARRRGRGRRRAEDQRTTCWEEVALIFHNSTFAGSRFGLVPSIEGGWAMFLSFHKVSEREKEKPESSGWRRGERDEGEYFVWCEPPFIYTRSVAIHMPDVVGYLADLLDILPFIPRRLNGVSTRIKDTVETILRFSLPFRTHAVRFNGIIEVS